MRQIYKKKNNNKCGKNAHPIVYACKQIFVENNFYTLQKYLYYICSVFFFIVMEICNGDYGAHIPELVESIQNGKSNVWRLDKTFYWNKEIITSQQLAPMRLYSFEKEFKHTPHYAANSWEQIRVLIKRNTIRLLRNKVIFIQYKFYLSRLFI